MLNLRDKLFYFYLLIAFVTSTQINKVTDSVINPFLEIIKIIPPISEIFVCSEDLHFKLELISKLKFDISKDINTGCKSKSQIVPMIEVINNSRRSSIFHIFIRFNESQAFVVLQKISKFYLIESAPKRPVIIWISLLTPSDSPIKLLNFLKRRKIVIPWQISTFVFEPDKIFELITIGNHFQYKKITKSDQHLLLDPDHDNWKRKENLHGTVLKAVAIDSLDERYSAEFDATSKEIQFGSGYTVNLLNDLRDTLNFRVAAIRGQEYITNLNESGVGGMGAQLTTQSADLVITMSYPLDFRVKYLSYSIAFSQDDVMIFFRQPKQNFKRNIFIHPFENNAWIALAVTLILVTFSTVLVANYAYYSEIKRRNWQCFWIIGALCQKNSSNLPRKFPGRVIFFTTFFMCWLIYVQYSASIVSNLAVSKVHIKNLMELIAANYKILADPLSSLSYSKLFSASSSQEWETFQSEVDSVSKIFKGNYGFITSVDLIVIASLNLGITEQEICKLSSVSLNGIVMPLGFYMRKGYMFKELINRKLLNSMSKGLNHRYKAGFLRYTKPVCPTNSKVTFETLGMDDLYSAFLSLTYVYLFSIGFLLFEKLNCRKWSHFI